MKQLLHTDQTMLFLENYSVYNHTFWDFKKETDIYKPYVIIIGGIEYVVDVKPDTLSLLYEAKDNKYPVLFNINEKKNCISDCIIINTDEYLSFEEYIDLLTKNKNIFYRVGDIWNIKYNQEFIQLKNFKGVNYVHHLLKNPLKWISYWELNIAINKPDRSDLELFTNTDTQSNISQAQGYYFTIKYKKAEEVDQALKSIKIYSREKEKYNKLLIKSEEENKPGKVEAYKDKISILDREIVSLKFKLKHSSFSRENSNKNLEKIRQAISQAYKQFKRTLQYDNTIKMYKHFTKSILSSNGYKYEPDDNTINWLLSD